MEELTKVEIKIKAENKENISITISQEVLEDLDEITKEENRSRSNMVEEMIKQYLKNRKQEQESEKK